jgi:thiamine biosynthesis protein ThiI
VKYLLRWGEIGLKSSYVRREMKRRLMANISRLLREEGGSCTFLEEGGRLFLESDHPSTVGVLGRSFGLVSFSPVEETSSALEDILNLATQVASSGVKRGKSFAVRSRRVGDHPYSSMDVAREVGAAILSAHPGLHVDLENPDWEIHVEVRGDKAYLYTDVIRGPGGIPLGSQGRVVALVEDAGGMTASWLMMKRGCTILPAFEHDDRWASALRYWDPDAEPRRVSLPRGMEGLAGAEGALGYVYPWDVDGVREEDLRPAFYPLLGLPKKKLEDLKRSVLEPVGLG